MFASEYGWSITQIMETPPDQKANLIHAMLYRRGIRTLKKSIGHSNEPRPSLADRAKAIFDTTNQS